MSPTNVDELFTASAAWTAMPKLSRTMLSWSAEERDAFLQMVVNRLEFLGGGVATLTADGGLAVPALWQGGALASVKGTLVSIDRTVIKVGDAAAQLSAWVIAGANAANTVAGALRYEVSIPAGDATVSLYAGAVKKAEGALGSNLGGTITLSAVGGSGLTGTVAIISGAVADAVATNRITLGLASGVCASGANAAGILGVVFTGGIPSGSTVMVVVAGRAKVLLENATGAIAQGWMRTGAPGRALCIGDRDASTIEQQVGYSLAAATAGADVLVTTELALR